MLKKDPIFSLTIPSKVQTYLACSRPILASLEGSGAEVIGLAGAGLVCPPGDGKALAKAALKLFSMPKNERECMGSRGRQFYEEHFERNMLIDRLVNIMDNLPAEPTG